MKVFVEKIYHFTCTSCRKWWSIADGKFKVRDVVYCPFCRTGHTVTSFEEGEEQLDEPSKVS